MAVATEIAVEAMMTSDPVCQMKIDEKAAKATATYQGRTFYFCSDTCKALFEQSPQTYVAQPSSIN
jgi:Cu+-exporting ATPase